MRELSEPQDRRGSSSHRDVERGQPAEEPGEISMMGKRAM